MGRKVSFRGLSLALNFRRVSLVMSSHVPQGPLRWQLQYRSWQRTLFIFIGGVFGQCACLFPSKSDTPSLFPSQVNNSIGNEFNKTFPPIGLVKDNDTCHTSCMKFVAYCRVSTESQKDNHSFESQLQQVQAYLASLPHPTELIQTFQECESGRVNSRPQLIAALALAKKHKAKLICSRMDRLTRSVSFLMTLIESNCEFVCLDCLGLDKFGLSVLALVASRERENIAIRTAAGLKIAREKLKAQNRRLGNPRPAEALRKATQANIANKEAFAQSALVSIRELQSVGIHSYNRLALSLNKRGEKTRLGKPWSPMAVKRVLQSTL